MAFDYPQAKRVEHTDDYHGTKARAEGEQKPQLDSNWYLEQCYNNVVTLLGQCCLQHCEQHLGQCCSIV